MFVCPFGRRLRRLAHQKLLKMKLGGEDEIIDQSVAFTFWRSENSKDLKLPDVCFDGLQSAICKGGFKVNLLTYKQLENVPKNTVVANAADFLEDRCSLVSLCKLN